jgi:hypothetical protein
MRNYSLNYSVLTLVTGGCLFAANPASVQVFALRDTAGLTVTRGMKAEAIMYQGRKAVRITKEGLDDQALATLAGTKFQDGVIEADVAVRVTTPPGARNPGFVGIAFRTTPDGSAFDLFYLRPGNSEAPDQAMRNHSAQYAAEPGFGWYRLRREWPWVYESHVDLEPEKWTKVKIEVAGRSAKLYTGQSTKPALVVDGLKSGNLHGGVALWSFTNEEAYFSNLRITTAVALPVKNGSDISGTWDLKYSSDYGVMEGSLSLRREGDHVIGTWSGDLGQDCPVKGTWRDGYVELSFPGQWPERDPRGAPGPVIAMLEGWIDGDSGGGRMRVEGRSDGRWQAMRH